LANGIDQGCSAFFQRTFSFYPEKEADESVLILYGIKYIFKRTSNAQKTFYIIWLFPLIVKTDRPIFTKKLSVFMKI